MDKKYVIFLNSVAFVLGFSLIFSVVGVLLQTALSFAAYDTIVLLRYAGGIVITLFGLFMILSMKYRIPFLQSEHKLKVRRFRISYLSSFVFGVAFAAGWTPCVGAILGSIYTLAASYPTVGFLLLFTYSLGIGIPFLIAGAFTSKITKFVKKSQRILKFFNIISGALLIIIGALIFFNYLGIIASFFVGPGESLSATGQINFFIAFLAGIITFISPCILPILPAFFSYMAGTTAIELSDKGKKK